MLMPDHVGIPFVTEKYGKYFMLVSLPSGLYCSEHDTLEQAEEARKLWLIKQKL